MGYKAGQGGLQPCSNTVKAKGQRLMYRSALSACSAWTFLVLLLRCIAKQVRPRAGRTASAPECLPNPLTLFPSS